MPPESDMIDTGIPGEQPKSNATTPAPSPSPTPVINWEDRYNGLQGYNRQVVTRAETAESKLSDALSQLESERTESAEAKKRADSATADLLKAQSELNKRQRSKTIQDMIHSEFPSLAGTMDTDDVDDLASRFADSSQDEDLRLRLVRKSKNVDGVVAQVTKEKISGGTPPSPPATSGNRGTSTSPQEALANMNRVLRTNGRGSVEYDAAFEAYNDALTNHASELK